MRFVEKQPDFLKFQNYLLRSRKGTLCMRVDSVESLQLGMHERPVVARINNSIWLLLSAKVCQKKRLNGAPFFKPPRHAIKHAANEDKYVSGSIRTGIISGAIFRFPFDRTGCGSIILLPNTGFEELEELINIPEMSITR